MVWSVVLIFGLILVFILGLNKEVIPLIGVVFVGEERQKFLILELFLKLGGSDFSVH